MRSSIKVQKYNNIAITEQMRLMCKAHLKTQISKDLSLFKFKFYSVMLILFYLFALMCRNSVNTVTFSKLTVVRYILNRYLNHSEECMTCVHLIGMFSSLFLVSMHCMRAIS